MADKTQDVFGLFNPATGALTALRTNDPSAPSLPLPTAGQVQALAGLTGGVLSAVTYDGGGRLTGYTRDGIAHTIDWTNGLAPVISNATGAPSRTITLDGSGRVTGIV